MLTLRSGPDRLVAHPEVSCGQDGKENDPASVRAPTPGAGSGFCISGNRSK